MKRSNQENICTSLLSFTAFMLWTLLVRYVDVQAVGPEESKVGLATINCFFHRLTEVHMNLYILTDWLGLVPVAVGFGFAILGLIQWIKRRNILKVDFSILVLGIYYIAVLLLYLFFESVVINYRPVLINGYLEASYPSSTTLLVTCVMPTMVMRLNDRIKNRILYRWIRVATTAFVVFMVVGRLISGVHWLSDIIGGLLLSAGMVMLYDSVCGIKNSAGI